MTDISCATWDTEEDKRMADEWAEKEAGNPCQMSPELRAEFEKGMPEVEKVIHQRCIECLEENAENAKNSIHEQITQKSEELTELDKLDQEVWPTHQQLDEMVAIGKELGVSVTEIISTPLICGTKDVENMDEKMRDMMWALHTQEKIPPWHRDDVVFSKIVFVDREEKGPTGVNKLADFNPETKVLHIFKTPEGVFPTKETIKWEILPHEVAHASGKLRQQILEYPAELKAMIEIEKTVATAHGKMSASPYLERLEEKYEKVEISGERLIEEWMAESFRRYVAGECAEVTREFFDKCFSE